MTDFDRENKYLRAKERVEELKKFYSSLFWYIIVISFLAWLNYYTNGWSYMWFLWAAFGWGNRTRISCHQGISIKPIYE